MKQIVIGDIHGRSIWKQIVDQPFDRVIFLGDYVDTHENITGLEQAENLRAIIDFKEKSNKEVILLIGNHDHHYWPGVGFTGTSGYQPGMKATFEYEFETYKDLFQAAFVDEHQTVFTHAGITETWLYDNGIGNIDIYSTVDVINDLLKYKPRVFNFYMGDHSHCGDNVHNSPIWVRPNSLYRDNIKNLQVVGHTTQNSINPRKSVRQGYYLIDTLGTSGEYLIITDGKITVGKCDQ
jgi:predicted MPP superfamily phosphohydrolase